MLEIVHSVPFAFYEAVFNAHLASNRQWYIPINAVCAALGIDPRSQRKRIQRDEAIADRLAKRRIATFRYQFPYMEAGRKRPNPPATLEATVRAAVLAATIVRY